MGLLPGAETYFVNRSSLLSLTTNPAYVSASVGANISKTQYYIAGDMNPNLASNQSTINDTLVFVDQDFSDDDLAINKSLFLMAESNQVTLNSFTINGAGAQADLINNFFLEEDLSLTNGFLNSDNFNRLILLPGCNVIGGSSLSFITGTLYAQIASSGSSVVGFPVGANGKYRNVSLNIDQATTDTVTYGLEMTTALQGSPSIPGSIEWLLDDHFWTFSSSSPANLNTVIATLSYDAPDGVFDPANLRMAFLESGSNSINDIGGTGDNAITGQITGNPVTTEGTFALANANGGNNFTGIDNPIQDLGIRVYPNPTTDNITVEAPISEGNTLVELVSIEGKSHFSGVALPAGKMQIEVGDLPRGSYFLLFRGERSGYARIVLH